MIKDLIIKTEKVDWQELKDLQPTNLKNPYHSNATKESLIKNGFAFTFYVWENEGNKYLLDGHLRSDLLRELKSEGHTIPDQLNCTFLDLPDRKTAVRYLLEVFNTKKNPIDEATMIDWMSEEDMDIEEVNVDWLDLQSTPEEIDYSEKNQEINLESLGNESTLAFKFEHKTYLETLARLNNAKESLECETNEETLLKLLEQYE
jgi:hypothetical protein